MVNSPALPTDQQSISAPPSIPVPVTHAHIQIMEAKAGLARRQLLERRVREASHEGAQSWFVSCNFDMGGPWAGVNSFFAALMGEILSRCPDLASHHAVELTHLLPGLQRTLKIPHASLTDLAEAHERVRNYAADRAFRLVHGLIDFLDTFKSEIAPDRKWYIACDDFDRSGFIGRFFFCELMRRRAESLGIYLVAAVEPGCGEATRQLFDPSLHAEVHALDLADQPPPVELAPDTAAEFASKLEEKVGEDMVAKEVHVTELVRLWQLAGRPDKLLYWKQFATEYYMRLGLYEDLDRYTEGLLSLAETQAPDDEMRRLWVLNKTLTAYMGAPDPSPGKEFVEEHILPCLEDPHSTEHVNLFFLAAMMYARYSKPRNLAKGEELLDRGIAVLNRFGESPLYHFQYVFNRNGLAMIRSFQGRFQEAIDLCRAGRDRLDQYMRSDQHRLHRSVLVYNIAQVYFAMGAYDEAIEHFTSVIALDPDFSEYHNERGNLFLRVGRLEEALTDYLEAIRLSAPYSEVHTNVGQCYRRMGRFHDAVASYTRSLDLKPNEPLALTGRAKAWEELGNREQAIADYTAALTQEPAHWEVLASRGVLYYEAGELLSSLADFDRAVNLAPDQTDLYRNRSVLLTDLDRWHEAASDIETVLRLDPHAEDRVALEEKLSAALAAVA